MLLKTQITLSNFLSCWGLRVFSFTLALPAFIKGNSRCQSVSWPVKPCLPLWAGSILHCPAAEGGDPRKAGDECKWGMSVQQQLCILRSLPSKARAIPSTSAQSQEKLRLEFAVLVPGTKGVIICVGARSPWGAPPAIMSAAVPWLAACSMSAPWNCPSVAICSLTKLPCESSLVD